MKSMKKLLAALLCLVTAFTFILGVGCGKKPGGSTWDGNIDFSQDGKAYKEVNDENVKRITVFKNDWDEFNQARTSKSPVYTKISNAIGGVTIMAQNTGGDQLVNQLALMQSSKDLPDIFLFKGPTDPEFFNNLIRNGDLLPISDWVSEEHYPNIYRRLKDYEYLRYNITYGKGKAWFIPAAHRNEKSLYVRQDWIDNLNAKLADCLIDEGVIENASQLTTEIREKWSYKLPTDLLEFYRLARAFTLYDPDNNGQNDTYGYVSESNKDMDAWIFNAFGSSWNDFMYNDAEGKKQYEPGDISDGSKYASLFITRLISEGYMSIDSLTNSNDDKQQKFARGDAGMMYAHNWLNVIVSYMMSVTKETVEQTTSKIALIEPPKGENGMYYNTSGAPFWQGFCINANMSNARIRKCLEFYDYLLSDEGYELLQYGVEGVHYEKDADGNKTSLLPMDENNQFRKGIRTYDTATFLYALVDWTMDYKSTLGTNADIISKREKESESLYKPADYPWLQTNAIIKNKNKCTNVFQENIVNLEKNENSKYYKRKDNVAKTKYNPNTFSYDDLREVPLNFRKTWESFVSQYLKNGGSDMIKEYNDYIASGKAKNANAQG